MAASTYSRPRPLKQSADDVAIQRVTLDKGPKDPAVLELTAVYHNLVRRWSEI